MINLDLKLTDSQFDFLESRKKFCLFRGGIGSGKTFIGSMYVLKKCMTEPKAKGFIGANTYRQLHNSTLSALFKELDHHNIPFKYNKNAGILKIFDTEIICMSLENYDVIRGIELGWFWADEVRDTDPEAFKVLMGRLRDRSAERLEGRLTSSPSGFDWQYDYFDGDSRTDEFEVVHGKSQDNPFLPDGYIDTLQASYDEKMYQQEVLGKVINIRTGAIYYAFDRGVNVTTVEHDTSYPLYIGMDFNINPMTAVVCQNYDNKLHVMDEIYMMSSDTNEMGEEIIRRYGTGHRIVPDSTGKRTQTSSSGWSDHRILESKGFKILGARNPFRLDRYNTVNNLLEKGNIRIDKRCVKLIRDLEQVSYVEGSTKADDRKDKTLTHISDALGYVAWYCYPILKPASSISMKPR